MPVPRCPSLEKESEELEREIPVDPAVESAVGITVEDLTALLRLESVRGIGPQKFKSIFEHGLRPADLLSNPDRFIGAGKRAAELRQQIGLLGAHGEPLHRARASRFIRTAYQLDTKILTYGPQYPSNVFNSNYPAPILFARGSINVLSERKVVACVGSRKIRPPYTDRHREFAEFALERGFTIASGFAIGADAIGHRAAALRTGGNTICVMPGGLDRPFPPEHKDLWDELLKHPGAVFVSEAPFGLRASALTLRKRNKLIVAFALGVLVSQTAVDGGAMNAFRFAVEAHKPVATFSSLEEPDTSGNALISKESRVPVATFDSGNPSPDAWERWLHQLSYSI